MIPAFFDIASGSIHKSFDDTGILCGDQVVALRPAAGIGHPQAEQPAGLSKPIGLPFARDGSQSRASAHAQWEECLHGSVPVGFSSIVTAGFLRLMTHPRVLVDPMPVAEAVSHMGLWMDQAFLRILLTGTTGSPPCSLNGTDMAVGKGTGDFIGLADQDYTCIMICSLRNFCSSRKC